MKKIITIIVLAAASFTAWFFIEKPEPPFGAVSFMELDNKTIAFNYEDSKTDENLVLKLTSNTYGNSEMIYFAVENTTAIDQNIVVVFTLKDNTSKVYDVKEFVTNMTFDRYASDSVTLLGSKVVTQWADKAVIEPNKTLLENAIKLFPSVKDKITVGSYYAGFTSSVPASSTKYYKFKIHASALNIWLDNKEHPPFEPSQEFYIEVFGDNGGYGHSY